jgi:hypothetical protein
VAIKLIKMKNLNKLALLFLVFLSTYQLNAQSPGSLEVSGSKGTKATVIPSVNQSTPVMSNRLTGLLYDNGPIFNSPGTGAGGANESYPISPVSNLAISSSTPARIADDFIITDNAWDIDSISFFDIIPLCPVNQFVYSAYYVRIWNGKPGENGSHVIWGDRTTNRLSSTEWSNAYRVDPQYPGSTTYPIFKNTCSTEGLILNAGHYWVEAQAYSYDVPTTYAPPVATMHPATGNATWLNEKTNVWQQWQSNTYPLGMPFLVYGSTVKKNIDAGIASLLSPVSNNGLTSTELVTINIKNYGSQSISNIPVSYSINGAAPIIATVAGPLASEQETSFTFPTPVDLSATGSYEIVVMTNLAGDEFDLNNSHSSTIYNYAIEVNMSNGIINACSGSFFDSGGEDNNYGDNESYVYTFIPATSAPNAKIEFNFQEFETEYLYDTLYVYDGPTCIAHPLLKVINGGNLESIGILRSTDPSGALTFRFVSDGDFNFRGWSAEFHCHIPYDHDLSATSVTIPYYATANTPSEYKVTVRNEGNLVESNYQVKLFLEDNTEIGSVNGVPLAYNEQHEFTILGTIPDAGLHSVYGKAVMANDQNHENDACSSRELTVHPSGTGYIIVGKDNEMNERLPISYVNYNSLSESIYYPEEIGMEGMITGTGFIYSFRQDFENAPLKIWIGETERTNLTDGWIPSTELTLVYDGSASYVSGVDTLKLDFTTPYAYHGGNLVMMVYRPLDYTIYPGTITGQNLFQVSTTPQYPGRTRNFFADIMIANPERPRFGVLQNKIPNTLFKFDVSMMSALKGIVTDSGNDPLEGALVTSAGSHTTSVTNNNGDYAINYIWAGNQDAKATMYAYNDSQATLTQAPGSTTIHNFTLENRPFGFVSGSVRPSDDPANGLENSIITLTGYDTTYTATSTSAGFFLITSVYGNATYHLLITHEGYEDYNNDITVGNGGTFDLGSVIMRELTAHPDNIVAVDNTSAANITWDVATLDYTIQYDNDSVYYYLTSYANERESAIRFTPAAYPCQLKKAILNVRDLGVQSGNPASSFKVKVYDDDSANNVPGTMLGEVTVTPVADGWCEVDLIPFNINITSGDFYLTHVQISSWPNYVEIGIDQSTHPENRSYSKPASWSSWALEQYYYHFMIRALVSGSSDGDYLLGSETPVEEPSRETESLTGYSVYRLHEGQESDTTTWTTLETNLSGNSYDDNDWSSLPWGEYKYAVRTNYTNGILSTPGFSNTLLKNMNTVCNLELITNTDYIPADALVILTNIDNDPEHVYSTNSNGAGSIQFNPFYRGTYRIQVTHHNFQPVEMVTDITTPAEIQILLTERTLPPVFASATDQDTLALVKWYNPTTLRDFIVDDSLAETSWAGTPGFPIWYGNYFANSYQGNLISCDLFFERHPFASAEPATIDIFDSNHNLIGTSESFVPEYDQWNTVRIPDLQVTGNFYAMVHFNQSMDDSQYLGMDRNGPNATANPGYVYNGTNWMTIPEYIPGINSGLFMVRPVISISNATDNTSTNSVSSSGNRSILTYSVFRLEPGQEDNPSVWIPMDMGVVSDSYPDVSWYTIIAGYYKYSVQCNYSTGLSSAFAFTNILEKELTYPAPLNLTILQTTEDQAVLSWSPVNRQDLVEYKVYLDNLTTPLASATDTTFTFTGLSVNVPYIAGVKSVFTSGESTMSTIEFMLIVLDNNSDEMKKPEIFPNPVRDVVFIAEAKGAQVEVYSTSGELMLKSQLEEPVSRLNLENLNSGIYLIKILRDNTVHTQKLVITK